jgi:hypothetical protein
MIVNKRKMSLGAVYLMLISFTREPGAGAALGFISFCFEFVGQRSHIMLGYRIAM